jgi:ATP-binding cassette subfamily B protein
MGLFDESAAPRPRGWIRRLVGYMAPHKRHAFVAFGVAIAGTTIASFTPLVQKVIIDDVIRTHRRPLAPWLVLLVMFGVARFGLAVIRRYRGGRIALDVQHDLRTAIFRQLQRLDFAKHDELQTGQLVSRASSDIALIQGLLQFMPIGVGNVLMFVISLVIMLFLSPLLMLVFLCVGPAVLFTAMRLRTSVFPASWEAQQRAGEVAGVVEESVTGVRVVKGFGQEQQQLDRLIDASRRLYGSKVRLIDYQARLQPALQVIPAFGQAAVLLLGGWLTIHDRLSLGSFLAFATYMLRLVPPVRMMAAILTVGQLARSGAERIFDLLDSTPLVQNAPDATALEVGAGRIEFTDVSFGYLRSEPVLHNFSLTIAPGETVALVGASGSGKSTVALLLPRFYDVQSGSVCIDDVDVRDVTLESLRSSIGVVFEDSFLFSDSVRANIAFGRPDATTDEIVAAARAAEAHDFIAGLVDGYDTVVGEQGLTLSGGQRQRVALARALISDPKLLVLDDATSSIDARVEEEIHATLQRLLPGRTTILIAHRRSTLDLADRIVVVDEGQVLDDGSYVDLMQRCPMFRRLLSGPGDDVEGLGVEADAIPDVSGDEAAALEGAWAPGATTAAAWPDLAGEYDASELVPSATPQPGAAMRFGGPPGGGVAGGMSMMAGGLAPTPDLMAKVAALPPTVDAPGVDETFEARASPRFRFLGFIRPYRRALAFGLALVALDAIATLAGPGLVRYGLDEGVRKVSERALWIAGIAFIAIALIDWLIMWAQARVLGRSSERLLHALRVKVFAHLQRLGLDYYDREMAGRVMTRMTTDIDSLQQLLQTGLVSALVNLVSFVGVGVALAIMSPKLALVTACAVPPLALATNWFRRRSTAAYEVARERIAAVNANLQEGLSGVRVSQAFAQERRSTEEFESISRDYLDARLGAQRLVAIYFPFVEFLSELTGALVIGAASVFVSDGSLTVGELIAFLLYLDLFFSPIQQLSQVFDSYQQAQVSLNRIGSLLATDTSVPAPAADDAVLPPRLRGEIEFDSVRFRYANTIDDALRGTDLHIRAGERVALVGETGAGKSTILKLVARFYDATAGSVRVDGIDVRAFDPVAFHAQLGVVPQEAFLFAGTIRDNIAYGRRGASDAEVEAAARAVGAHEFIAHLSFGYRTPVSERGRSLSSGQRQLIALARAHLVDPAILLLDEATSNLDLATEAKVSEAMNIAATGRTTILVAHRLQTARIADRIIVIDDGRVVEDGTHDALLARDGFYARLWEASESVTAA